MYLSEPTAGQGDFLTASEAAQRLGVDRASLYAYVSRGLVRSVAHDSDPRARLYCAADIDALITRKRRGHRASAGAASALSWGLPVLETRLTRIDNGQLSYRGEDAIALSETSALEDVACLLWQTTTDDPFRQSKRMGITHRRSARLSVRSGYDFVAAIVQALAPVAADEPPGLPPEKRIVIGAELVNTIVSACGAGPDDVPIHERLAAGWHRPQAADAIRRALVLCADHELNASTFAVRVAASTGAALTMCLLAGAATLSGPLHGGATERVTALLDELTGASSAQALVRSRLDRGEAIPGFGQKLYPKGDPRAAALLPFCNLSEKVEALIDAVEQTTGLRPTIDFALVAAERSHQMPRGAALALFAAGRSVGWVAHAIEQSETGSLIRPRARFVS